MAQQQIALESAGPAGFGSRRDRPALVRLVVAFGRFMKGKPLGAAGVVLIVLMVVTAAAAPVLQRYDKNQVFQTANPAYDPAVAARALEDPLVRLKYPPEAYTKGGIIGPQDPSASHWFGTDKNGRDMYARIVWGARTSVVVGVGAAVIAVAAGLVLGLISAYFGGLVDLFIQRGTDAMLAFPALILLLLFVQVVPNPTVWTITVALGIVGIAQTVRIVRSAVLTAREEQYVMAAQVIGASDRRIMFRHILPNIMAPTIVIFTISIGAYILAESTLAFIGLGDPVAPSWGKELNEGRQLLSAKPFLSIFPGLAIMLTVLGYNLAGDALRDVLDPRLRRGR
jgi:peptide/nickel transport system permease protein